MSAVTQQPIMDMQLQREGGIAILMINNRSRRNAWSDPVKNDALRYFRELIADKSCRAIVLTGAGDAFSSGGDIKTMKEKGEAARDFMWRRLDRQGATTEIINMMVSGPKPVITAVEGPAFGVGLGLAVSSDFTVAASNARFAVVQIRRGICPDGLMYYTVTARCGPGRARELLLSGREFGAVEAEKYGLVHEITEPGKALETAVKVAERFAEVPPLAFALTKAAMTNSYHSMGAALRAEQDYAPVVGLSKDHKESVAAFLEKRKPVYTGE